MTNDEFKILAGKVADGTASMAELALYNASYESFQSDVQHLSADGLDATALKKESIDRFWKVVAVSRPSVKLWPQRAPQRIRRIAAVAAAVTAITLGVWLYYASAPSRHLDSSSLRAQRGNLNDIAPGRNTATLTLASGEVINLDTNKTSVVVADSVAASTMLTASTPRGGTYQFTLPDGSKVWLNADSKISFASNFLYKNTRNLKLVGEAYFEVTKDKKRPFIVESAGQKVEVLGTHFNINSYADEGSTKTTLLEGSVSVSYAPKLASSSLRGTEANPQGAAITLKPNQQATLNGESKITIKQIDPAEAIAWKEGNFVFEEESLYSIMRKLARWYDIEVIYGPGVQDADYTGVISRNKNISQVLEILERSKDIRFKIEGRRVTVTK